MAQKLTDRTIFAGTVDKDNDLIHLVDVSDTSQDPAGSSFSCVPKKFINSYISSGSETEGQTLYYDSTTGKYLNTSILHVDDGNSFVGIGITSALTAKLHVKSASGNALKVDGSSLSGLLNVANDGTVTMQNIEFRYLSNTAFYRNTGNGTHTWNSANDINNIFKIDNNGKIYVGLNTSQTFGTDAVLLLETINGASDSTKVTSAIFSKASTNKTGIAFASKEGVSYIQGNTVNSSQAVNLVLGAYDGISAQLETLRLTSGGYNVSGIKTSALADGSHNNSEMSFWVDEVGNTLNFKVKYSSGTVKSGSIALT